MTAHPHQAHPGDTGPSPWHEQDASHRKLFAAALAAAVGKRPDLWCQRHPGGGHHTLGYTDDTSGSYHVVSDLQNLPGRQPQDQPALCWLAYTAEPGGAADRLDDYGLGTQFFAATHTEVDLQVKHLLDTADQHQTRRAAPTPETPAPAPDPATLPPLFRAADVADWTGYSPRGVAAAWNRLRDAAARSELPETLAHLLRALDTAMPLEWEPREGAEPGHEHAETALRHPPGRRAAEYRVGPTHTGPGGVRWHAALVDADAPGTVLVELGWHDSPAQARDAAQHWEDTGPA